MADGALSGPPGIRRPSLIRAFSYDCFIADPVQAEAGVNVPALLAQLGLLNFFRGVRIYVKCVRAGVIAEDCDREN